MTPGQHRSERDRVRASLQLAESPEDRHGVYSRRLAVIPGGTVTAETVGRSTSGIGMLIAATALHPEMSHEGRGTELHRLAAHLRGQVDALDELLRRGQF